MLVKNIILDFVHNQGCMAVYESRQVWLYAFFWVIPQRLNFICRCFGTLSVPSS